MKKQQQNLQTVLEYPASETFLTLQLSLVRHYSRLEKTTVITLTNRI